MKPRSKTYNKLTFLMQYKSKFLEFCNFKSDFKSILKMKIYYNKDSFKIN